MMEIEGRSLFSNQLEGARTWVAKIGFDLSRNVWMLPSWWDVSPSVRGARSNGARTWDD
jgi:hypothetical protein